MVTKVREFYEQFNAKDNAKQLAQPRKRAGPGQFNYPRLRMLQDFIHSVGNAGLSVSEIKMLYNLLCFWERNMTGGEEDDEASHRHLQRQLCTLLVWR